ncbi:MAG: EamA family transporter [Clostridia bacterium]|nr:EamA family transporter [Clostridia bacterium]
MKKIQSPAKTFKNILIIQGVVIIYTFATVIAKFASEHEFLSFNFILLYALEIAVLGIYALLWQQVIKRFDLSVAYANRSLSLLWAMLWAVLIFSETITLQNIIGVIIVIIGTIIVNYNE